MGLAMTISMTAEAFLFWQLGSLARKHAVLLRPIIAAFAIAYLAIAVNSWCYFFQAPVVVEILIALCLILAVVTAKPATTA